MQTKMAPVSWKCCHIVLWEAKANTFLGTICYSARLKGKIVYGIHFLKCCASNKNMGFVSSHVKRGERRELQSCFSLI